MMALLMPEKFIRGRHLCPALTRVEGGIVLFLKEERGLWRVLLAAQGSDA